MSLGGERGGSFPEVALEALLAAAGDLALESLERAMDGAGTDMEVRGEAYEGDDDAVAF